MKIVEINGLINESIERVASKEEADALIAYQAEIKAVQDAIDAEANSKAEAKAALLDRLGITAEEAALLLG